VCGARCGGEIGDGIVGGRVVRVSVRGQFVQRDHLRRLPVLRREVYTPCPACLAPALLFRLLMEDVCRG
jgi:hypothetical protein